MTIQTHSLKLMGTKIDLQIDSDDPNFLIQKCVQQLHMYDQRFSANNEHSELMLVNHKAGLQPVKVHPQLYDLITLGKKHSLEKPSYLNIAIGPLVKNWHIGFQDAHLPSSESIQRSLKLTNPEWIGLNDLEHSVFLKEQGMQIDLGAIAKGYIADQIMDYLISQSVTSAMINLGGNVLVHGPNRQRPDQKWYIGIQNPTKKRGENVGILKITDQSVVTSGIYERNFHYKGKTYHHIFDPKTGYPVETDMASLTVVSKRSVDCEIWTTRLFGLPIAEVLRILNENPMIEGIIVTKDNHILISESLKKHYNTLYSS